MTRRVPLPTPKGLPPAYHPFEGDGKVCAYCQMPRRVHLDAKEHKR